MCKTYKYSHLVSVLRGSVFISSNNSYTYISYKIIGSMLCNARVACLVSRNYNAFLSSAEDPSI